jgi:hypothetical protein
VPKPAIYQSGKGITRTTFFLIGVTERHGTQHHIVAFLNTNNNTPYLKAKSIFSGI